MPIIGKVFRIADAHLECHFWIVISEERRGRFLAVNVTDGAKCKDSPCQLSVGDHTCITKPSAIVYRKARDFAVDELHKEIACPKSLYFFHDANSALISRIVEGAKKADDLTRKFLAYI